MSALNRLQAITGQIQPVARGNVRQNDTSAFEKIPLASPDAVFEVKALFLKDSDPVKINLGIGAYRDSNGKPLVLNVVRKAEKIIANNDKLDHEYLGIGGDQEFVTLARNMLYGAESAAVKEGRIAAVQALSGTGALRIAASFIAEFLPGRAVYYSNPTWGNHQAIFKQAGLKHEPYRYWDAKARALDIAGLTEDLNKAPNGSVVLLHACAHNPTGVDPTQDQWKAIAKLCKEKNFLPFFDSAYQGFASGDLEKDAWAVRYFAEQGFELITCQSFAKNFGLYNERVGTCSIICADKKSAASVLSQIELIIRPMYSNPPAYGARIVKTILGDAKLYAEWREELAGMSNRITEMRTLLKNNLVKLGTPGNWDHIVTQIGMFSYTGLNKKQCEILRNELHVYLLLNGRISMAGINPKNVEYLAKAIDQVVRRA